MCKNPTRFNKFADYLSSQITPQDTLLQKFNKVLEYLKQNPPVNLFVTISDYTVGTTAYNKSFLLNTKYTLESEDLVLFKNGFIGFVQSVGNDTFTVLEAIELPKGKQGIQGEQGEQGEQGKGINVITTGSPSVSGSYTQTPLLTVFTDGSTSAGTIFAKNGADGQKGATGQDGIGISNITIDESYISGDKTITPITIKYTNSVLQNLAINAQNGSKGNGIVDMSTISHTIENNETITKIQITYDEEEPQEIEVHALNGSEKYTRYIKVSINAGDYNGKFYFSYKSDNNTNLYSLDDLVNDLYENGYQNIYIQATGSLNHPDFLVYAVVLREESNNNYLYVVGKESEININNLIAQSIAEFTK